ncbi:thiamine diphosphokinase [Mucilaginibacter limnophilus]|uniref:Thiamine diphosphokinase n=1 Tax=Mucilaginibacter limnophilus TaxID=1932778 RepID=A0A3S2Y169_9SPHI|nr:thiamine diphosphokinase [Mucilaginibacter limnophilus]RVT98167.1 thiamine diphosphokinase [Mucilaginibacter limnophilus]
MSSHHVVREKQEPALLVLGMDSFDDELLGQLLEWSPTVIVTEDTAEQVHARGIKIDCIISNDENGELQSDIKYLPAGNDTLTEAALKYLVTHNYPAVNIVTDELQLKDVIFFADKINLVIYNAGRKIYAVNSGFNKWKPAGEIIELLVHPHQLHTGGLEHINNNRFKTTHDGFFSLQFDQPFIFIAEEIA